MSELDQYDYELPKELIAQVPLNRREDARLLVADRQRQSIEHRHVRDLPEIIAPADCLVLNDTKVIPARLVGYRTDTGGRWEGLFLDADEKGFWRVMGKTRGKLTAGESITLVNASGHEDVSLRLVDKREEGVWVVKPESDEDTLLLLDRAGRVPLPPYIRKGEMVEADRDSYQTVFARTPGAVAAPTAGLHFTERLLRKLKEQGTTLCRLTLHVGVGTFRPISSDVLSVHKMHSEWGCIDEETALTINDCRKKGGRIVSVGSTSTRLLETAAASSGDDFCHDMPVHAFSGHTDLFIRPPYTFRAVDVLMTNFHLPKTTLLVLVRTFGGDELIRRAYEEAVGEEYRFYSYGDSMIVV
ncbi:MAG: tRNA preQ1(34) S-adenosylmethionine ribosyltransferase-isomerase QueA [Pirellulales bacterium]|nr:tRNA preQ1(34) S-adenosylmethionine ribosyltransferase-isomerase QueA [Pirellulales bacterium]